MKILIIGLDGATWNVLDDFLLEQCMPNLNKLKSDGSSGVLRSTEPPITASSWTTCITGCQPCTHGIIGWHEYSCSEDQLRISTSGSCKVPNIWQELSKQSYKVASINVPWTYPCKEVNGIIVAGYGCPGPESQFTYPSDFKDELLRRIPDYDIVSKWDKSREYSLNELDANMKRVERSFQQRVETAKLVSEKINWDVMMIQIHDTDLIEHHIWPYLDKTTRDQFPQQRDRIFESFKHLDVAIGSLLELVSTEESMVVVVSDHGLFRKIARVKPNVMLCQWGYLEPKGTLRTMIQRRLRKSFDNVRGKEGKKSGIKQPKEYDFKWTSSKAMVIDTAVNGHLFINVKGRQPDGIVEPGTEYDELLKELRERFTNAVNPHTGELIFSKVGTPSEVYDFTESDTTMFGDLVLVPQPGIELVLSDSRDGEYIEMTRSDSLMGAHCYEGIYLFSGRNIKCSIGKETQIVNIAPTIYAALGAELPTYMDGNVLETLFEKEIPIVYQKGRIDVPCRSNDKQILSTEEEAEITKRLSALGYVE
jgi:predicted AlkP superfamily phosphohydrolase/phosphomutase